MPNGSLETVMQRILYHDRPSCWTPVTIMKMVCGIAHGMIYLHSQKIVHGRLHPRNIHFDKDWTVHIGDYVGVRVKPMLSAPDPPFQVFTGPEVFQTGQTTMESDVYSFGMLLYYCLVDVPFGNAAEMLAVSSAVDGHRPVLPLEMSTAGKDLITKCWDENPTARPSFTAIHEILSGDWQMFFRDVPVAEIQSYEEELETSAKRKHRESRFCAAECTEIAANLKKRSLTDAAPLSRFIIPDINEFAHVRILGEGPLGLVSLVERRSTNTLYAIKRFQAKVDVVGFLPRLVTVLNLSHECIVPMLGFGPSLIAPEIVFASEAMTHGSLQAIFQQVVDGKTPDFWTHQLIATTALRIVVGMQYVHNKGLVHGSLHPGNILFDDDNRAHICDILRPDYRSNVSQNAHDQSYTAPELMQDEAPKETWKVDSYAFGLILYQMLVGRSMWADCCADMNLVEKVARGMRPSIPDNIHTVIQEVIRRCLAVDPANRPSFDQILTEFETADFPFFPDVPAQILRDSVTAIRVEDSVDAKGIGIGDAHVERPLPPAQRRPRASVIVPTADFAGSHETTETDDGEYMAVTRKSDGMEFMYRGYASWLDSLNSAFLEKLEQWLAISHPSVAPVTAILSNSIQLGLVLGIPWGGLLKQFLGREDDSIAHIWTEETRAKIIVGIAYAIDHLHSNGVTHGHLTSKTVVVEPSGFPLITDLAIPAHGANNVSGPTGDPKLVAYIAPEIFNRIVITDERPADVYSYGILLYELLTNRPFFHDIPCTSGKITELWKTLASGQRPLIPATICPGLQDLIKRCWSPTPTERPTSREIIATLEKMKHRFFGKVPSAQLSDYLTKVRAQRGGDPVSAPRANPEAADERQGLPNPDAADERQGLPSPDAADERQGLTNPDAPDPRPELPALVPENAPRVAEPAEVACPRLSALVMDFGHLEFVRDLGRGGVGVVKLLRDGETKQELAVKVIQAGFGFNRERFIREIEVLSLSHPCLMGLIGFAFPVAGINASAMIAMEFMSGGGLDAALERVRRDNRPTFWSHTGIAIIIVGIVLGMRFLHSQHVIHRDLKPGNILLDGAGRPRICDFGSARSTLLDTTPTPAVSTPTFRAPEMFDPQVNHTEKVDVYSFGLLLFELLVGWPVFSHRMHELAIAQDTVNGRRPEIPKDCMPKFLKTLIRQCWGVRPERRPTFNEIIATLKAEDYLIYPDIDKAEVTRYVEEVERMERQ
jgi:serine/threonine protein kinase